MRVILCDDDPAVLQALENKVKNHLKHFEDLAFSVRSYADSQTLLFDLEDLAKADVYLLDIDMPGINGLDIADRLKDLYPHMLLIFYTSHAEFATRGYRMGVQRYILKNGDEEELYEALDHAVAQDQTSRKDTVSLFSYHDTVNCPVDDILYVERSGRTLKLKTQNNGVLYDTRSIRDLIKVINDPRFLQIDKGVVINVDHVFKTEDNTVTMFDRKTFDISRRRARLVKEAIMKYWKEE